MKTIPGQLSSSPPVSVLHHTLLPSAFFAVWLEEIHLFNFSYKQPAQSKASHSNGLLVNPKLQNILLFSISREWRLLGSRTIYLLFIYQINTYVKWVLFAVTFQQASTTATTIIVIIITSNSLHSHKFVHSIRERSDAKAFGKWRKSTSEWSFFGINFHFCVHAQAVTYKSMFVFEYSANEEPKNRNNEERKKRRLRTEKKNASN